MITIDFETRSIVNIKLVGAWEYATHASTQLICLAYAFGNGPVKLWHRWLKDEPQELFEAIESGMLVEAHNVFFERCIWRHICQKRRGWPAVQDHQWRCSMAKAAVVGLPASLEQCAIALNLQHRKDIEGKKAMQRMSSPVCVEQPGVDLFGKHDGGVKWHEKEIDKQLTFDYCKQDVETERAISHALPDLTPRELKIWRLDQKINLKGIKVDRELCARAIGTVELESKQLNQELAQLTNYQVKTSSQIKELKAWCGSQGVNVPTLAKDAVRELVKSKRVPANVKRALVIRQLTGKTSTGKYKKMLLQSAADSRLHGQLRYHGAFTGRWAGQGAQIHNFPRGSVKEIDLLADTIKIQNLELLRVMFGNPVQSAVSALRPTLTVEDGNTLLVWDYGQIEARGLAWIAGEQKLLDVFARGDDPYKFTASGVYAKPIDAVTDDERFIGKQMTLGLGYGMGWQTFQSDLEIKWDVLITESFAQRCVETYRKNYKRIKQFWYGVERAAIRAVTERKRVKFGRVSFDVELGQNGWPRWLWCTLPSSRRIYYYRPEANPYHSRFGLRYRLTYRTAVKGRLVRISTYGGKLTENIVQALARDAMADGMLRLDANGYEIVGTVHDEILVEAGKGQFTVADGVNLLEQNEPWCKGLPLVADGFESKRYRK